MCRKRTRTVMIYLIEGVLPESYFANNLRGLSVDMAVFRDLLRLRLPTLSRHLEQLQHDARDTATGTSYEPPLTNVFTMQWFLTLFSNCLPQPTVLRVWDLIFLEGNEVLLRTALAIWDGLQDRIMAVDSADEFYSIMGVLTREMLEFGLMDTNNLVKTIVTIAPFPFPELPELRDKYLYNITPWTHTVSSAARRGLRLFYSDDDDDGTDEDDERIAVAAAYGISAVFRSPRRRDSLNRAPSPSSTTLSAIGYSPTPPDRDRLALDISALKQQYAKLRERQRQAHIILTACARQPLGPSVPTPVAMNHLLLGKSALLSVRGRRGGPPAGAVPPPANIALKSAPKPHKSRQQHHVTPQGQLITSSNVEVVSPQQQTTKTSGETLHWKDATRKKLRRGSQDVGPSDAVETSLQGVIEESIPKREIPIIKEPETVEAEAEDEVESDDSKSSTSTELCDEPDRLSDFDSEEPTSISDASSYVPSASEAVVTKMPCPIVEKSDLPTPESIVPLSPIADEEVSPSKQELMLDNIVTSKSSELIVSELTSPLSPLLDISDLEPSLEQEPSPLLDLPCDENDDMQQVSEKQDENITLLITETQTPANVTIESQLKLSPIAEPFFLNLQPKTMPEGFTELHDVSTCITPSPSPDVSNVVSPLQSLSVTDDDQIQTLSPEISISSLKDYVPDTSGEPTLVEKSPETPDHTSFQLPQLKMDLNTDEIIAKDIKEESFTSWITTPGYVTEPVSLIISPSSPDNVQEEKVQVLDAKSPVETEDEVLSFEITQDSQKTEESLPSRTISPAEHSIGSNGRKDTPSPPRSHSVSPIISISLVTDEDSKITGIAEEIKTDVSASSSMVTEVCLNGTKETTKEEDEEEVKVLSEVSRDKGEDEITDIVKLLQLNQSLQEKEKDIRDGIESTAERKVNEIDYSEMSELLELGENINLGRRNSERALQIIQENSEILQRIMLCQARRPSKLSEEGSNGGTTIPSEANSNLPSIPTSSSAENVDITSSQQIQSVVTEIPLPKTDSDSCTLSVSPKDSVSHEKHSEVLSSPSLPWTPITNQTISQPEKISVSPPDVSLAEETVHLETQSSCPEEEHDKIKTEDIPQFSFPVMSDEFQVTQVSVEPKSTLETEPLSSSRSFSISPPEIPNTKVYKYSLDSTSMRPGTETDFIYDEKIQSHSEGTVIGEKSERTTILSVSSIDDDLHSNRLHTTMDLERSRDRFTIYHHSLDEKIQSHSEDKIGETSGTSVSSVDDLHTKNKVHRPLDLEMNKDSFATYQSDWKKLPTDSSITESQSSKLPKCYSPEASTYSSYSSRGAAESCSFLDSPVKPISKWTDDESGVKAESRSFLDSPVKSFTETKSTSKWTDGESGVKAESHSFLDSPVKPIAETKPISKWTDGESGDKTESRSFLDSPVKSFTETKPISKWTDDESGVKTESRSFLDSPVKSFTETKPISKWTDGESGDKTESRSFLDSPVKSFTETKPISKWTDDESGVKSESRSFLDSPAKSFTETKPISKWIDDESAVKSESRSFLDSPVKSFTETKPISKWTDNSDITTEKHKSRTETSDTSKFSIESTSRSSWFLEKSKIKDDSDPKKSTFDSDNLFSRPSSSYSSYSSDTDTSKPYSSRLRYEYSPPRTKSRSNEKESSTDYFQQDKHRDTISSWSSKESVTRPSDSYTFKSSSDRIQLSPVDDFLRDRSYSPKRRYTEDSQYSFRPSATSNYDFSSGTQDVIRRTPTRDQTRPHSTIISDLESTEILNRSYSSSSIDGYLSRTRREVSPPSSPDHKQSSVSSFRSVLDDTTLSTEKSRSRVCSPIYELDSPIRSSSVTRYRHSSPRRERELSPPTFTSFSESRWDKGDSSLIKPSTRKHGTETQLSPESSLADTRLSSSKLGKSYSPSSPTKTKDIHVSLPPIKSSSLGSPTRSKSKFDPFPPRPTTRQPKELGIKLGLYSSDNIKNGKSTSKKP